MLEQLLIFTRGGLVLWTCQELGKALKGSPIDALIRYSKLAYKTLKQFYVLRCDTRFGNGGRVL